jgi:hypothetical protein
LIAGALVVAGIAGYTSPPPFGQARHEDNAGFTELTVMSVDGRQFRASSTLEADSPYQLGTYGMQTLFDSDPATGWSEGVDGPGIGEVLWIGLDEGADHLLVRNGFARTARLFAMNNRVKELDVSLWRGVLPEGMVSEWTARYVLTPVSPERSIQLRDTWELQEVALPVVSAPVTDALPAGYAAYAQTEGLPPAVQEQRLFVRLEISSVFPGTRWDDTCLTEVIPVPREDQPNVGDDAAKPGEPPGP